MSSENTVVFSARKIVTMNPSRPTATHVAVRGGKIVAVGRAEELASIEGVRDDRFREKVLLPGFVEGHSHIVEGIVWAMPYVGVGDRRSPDGKLVEGARSVEAVIDRLKEADRRMADPEAALFAWGFDPLHIGGRKLTRQDLDQASVTRPVLVVHARGHITNVNTLILERADLLHATSISGVIAGSDGTASGELQGPAARFRVYRAYGDPLFGDITPDDIARYEPRPACSTATRGLTSF